MKEDNETALDGPYGAVIRRDYITRGMQWDF
jgi:hypothetical protein